jgi:MarR family transcriptional regulator, organic hydroperoxide resistance regulator
MHSILNQFSREVSRHYDSQFAGYNLATSYVELLIYLDEAEEATQKMIAEQLGLAPSTITRFIAKLEKMGYVEKSRDGKEMSVKLSGNKAETVNELKKLYLEADKKMQKIVGEKFVDTTSKLLEYGVEQFNIKKNA